MKQRLAGKIIKHPERYSLEKLIIAYSRLMRSLRKWYIKMSYKEKGCYSYYWHMASRPTDEIMADVNDIWNIKE